MIDSISLGLTHLRIEDQNQLRQRLRIEVMFQTVNSLMLLIFHFNCVSHNLKD